MIERIESIPDPRLTWRRIRTDADGSRYIGDIEGDWTIYDRPSDDDRNTIAPAAFVIIGRKGEAGMCRVQRLRGRWRLLMTEGSLNPMLATVWMPLPEPPSEMGA